MNRRPYVMAQKGDCFTPDGVRNDDMVKGIADQVRNTLFSIIISEAHQPNEFLPVYKSDILFVNGYQSVALHSGQLAFK